MFCTISFYYADREEKYQQVEKKNGFEMWNILTKPSSQPTHIIKKNKMILWCCYQVKFQVNI